MTKDEMNHENFSMDASVLNYKMRLLPRGHSMDWNGRSVTKSYSGTSFYLRIQDRCLSHGEMLNLLIGSKCSPMAFSDKRV